MPTGSTTTNQVSSTNPALTNMFTTLFGTGGAGGTGVSSLQNIAGGGNITSLNAALTASNSQAFGSNVAQIKEAFGSTGMGSSSSLQKVLGQAATNNATNLTGTLANADLTAQGQQLSAANYLTSIFSQAANNYYTSSSTKDDSGMSTFLNTFSTLFSSIPSTPP